MHMIHLGKRGIAALASAVMLVTLAGCGGSENGNSGSAEATAASDTALATQCLRPEQKKKIVLGVSASLAYAHVYVAKEEGFFDEENLDVQFTKISNPADTLPLISQGQIDGAFGGLSAGFFNAVDRGLNIRLVQARGEYPAGPEKPAGFYVRSDLIEDGTVKTVSDLKGKTIGLAGGEGDIGNSGGYFISRILAEGGLTLKDVKWANVSQGDTAAAFRNKAIDAAFLPSPFSTNVVESGLGKPFGNQELLTGETSGGLILGPNLLVEDRVAGVALLRALLRAGEVMAQGDYRENPKVVDALLKHGYKEESIKQTPLYAYEPELPLNPKTVETFQRTFLDHGNVLTIKQPMAFEDITDEPLRKAAVSSRKVCGR